MSHKLGAVKELFETAAQLETKRWGGCFRIARSVYLRILGRGKRVRPVLSFAVCELFGTAAPLCLGRLPWNSFMP